MYIVLGSCVQDRGICGGWLSDMTIESILTVAPLHGARVMCR